MHNKHGEKLLTNFQKKSLPYKPNFFFKFGKMNVTLRFLDMLLHRNSISQPKIIQVIELRIARPQFFFKKGILKNVKKIEKIHMDSEKSINSFLIKNDRLSDYLLNNYFVNEFINNFSTLLFCKINVLDFFDSGDFFKFLLYREILEF